MTQQTTASIVNYLFEKLIAISPAFKQAWPNESEFQATKKEWVLAFVESNINSIEFLKKGLAALRKSPTPFVPSPGEFIEMCYPSPEDIGAPSLESAYREATYNSHPSSGEDKKWTHDVVRHAWLATGSWILSQYTRDKSLALFKKHYEHAIFLYASGGLRNQLEDKTKDNSKNRKAYQEYVTRLKSDIRLRILPGTTRILSYNEWLGRG